MDKINSLVKDSENTNLESLDKETELIVANLDDDKTRSQLINLGSSLSGRSSSSYNLMKTKMAHLMQENPQRKNLESDMEAIRQAVDDLSPDKLGRLSFWRKIISKNPMGRKLIQIQEGYESAEERLSSIEKGLEKGSSFLVDDNSELSNLFKEISLSQSEIEKNVYILEGVVSKIKSKHVGSDVIPDPRDITFESEMVNKLQDFKIIMEANKQFQTAISVNVQGNHALLTKVRRLSNIVGTVARAGLMVQASLLRQKGMIDLVEGTESFIGNTLKSNAEMVRDNVKSIKKTLSSPSLDIDTVIEAHKVLKEAVEDAYSTREEVMNKSFESLDKLNSLLKDLPSPSLEEQNSENLKYLS